MRISFSVTPGALPRGAPAGIHRMGAAAAAWAPARAARWRAECYSELQARRNPEGPLMLTDAPPELDRLGGG